MTVSDVINLELLAHPYNWIIVVLMLALSSFALCLILDPPEGIGGLFQA